MKTVLTMYKKPIEDSKSMIPLTTERVEPLPSFDYLSLLAEKSSGIEKASNIETEFDVSELPNLFSNSSLSQELLHGLTIDSLRKMCKKYGITQHGNKAELIQRLLNRLPVQQNLNDKEEPDRKKAKTDGNKKRRKNSKRRSSNLRSSKKRKSSNLRRSKISKRRY